MHFKVERSGEICRRTNAATQTTGMLIQESQVNRPRQIS